jgi:molybdopterin-guanine dinucleotide biosynthesis protein A
VLGALAMTVELGTSCCVPVHADGTVEPLCAVYDRIVCAPLAAQEELFSPGAGAAKNVLLAANGTAWPIAEHLSAGEAERIFSNVNTPDDLERARRWLSPEASA